MVSSKVLRALLDAANDATKVAPKNALREQLRVYERDALDAISGGSILSTSANGRHVALASATGGGTITSVDIVEAWRRLVDVFDQSALALGFSVDDDQHDAAIYAQMMVDLREITGYTTNFMYLSK